MRPVAPLPAATALPLPRARSHRRRQRIEGIDLSGLDIAQFNAVLHELNPDAPHLDADALVSVARWLAALPEPQAQAMLQVRLIRLDELRALIADRDWLAEAPVRSRVEKILAYVEAHDDLIPDSTPQFGRLDDALLIELAWPSIADELDDFLDFSRFREESGHLYFNRPERDDWLTTRLEEGALWEQLHRVRQRPYVNHSPIQERFRVI